MEQKKFNNSFCKLLTKKGKKEISENLYYNLKKQLKIKTNKNPNFILNKAVKILLEKINLKIISKKFNKFSISYNKYNIQEKQALKNLINTTKKKSKNLNNFIENNILEILNLTKFNKSVLLDNLKYIYNTANIKKYDIKTYKN